MNWMSCFCTDLCWVTSMGGSALRGLSQDVTVLDILDM